MKNKLTQTANKIYANMQELHESENAQGYAACFGVVCGTIGGVVEMIYPELSAGEIIAAVPLTASSAYIAVSEHLKSKAQSLGIKLSHELPQTVEPATSVTNAEHIVADPQPELALTGT